MKYLKTLLMCLVICLGLFVSCQDKNSLDANPVQGPNSGAPATGVKTISNLNWDRANGTYFQSMAISDFGKIADWNTGRASIADNTFRVLLLKDLLSGYGGLVGKANIEEGSEYKLSYELKFDKDFEWGKGGKVGFGLRIGENNTGCDRADDGNGGSARLMWYTSNGNTKFKPYMYYKDMPGTCGDNVVNTAVYPATGSIQKDTWYTIAMYVKSNTGTNTDGKIEFSINGITILNQNIRWTTNDTKRLINKLSMDIFRGGSTDDWKTPTDGYIYFDNLKVEKLK